MLRGFLVVYVLLDVGAVAVWRSELTLWAHAATLAPHSMRSSNNYLKARLGQ